MFFLTDKKNLKYIAAIIALTSALYGCNDSEKDTSGKTSVTATSTMNQAAVQESTELFETDTFTISLGTDWVYDQAASEAAAQSLKATCYYFYHPGDNENADSVISEHLTIAVDNLSNTGKDFATFKDLAAKQMNTASYTVNSTENTSINGYEAWKAEYVAGSDNQPTYNYLISMNVENVIYSFTFTSGIEDYESHLGLVDTFVSSAIFK